VCTVKFNTDELKHQKETNTIEFGGTKRTKRKDDTDIGGEIRYDCKTLFG
jgi:hypothetical protein